MLNFNNSSVHNILEYYNIVKMFENHGNNKIDIRLNKIKNI